MPLAGHCRLHLVALVLPLVGCGPAFGDARSEPDAAAQADAPDSAADAWAPAVPPSCVAVAARCGPREDEPCCASSNVPATVSFRTEAEATPATVSAFAMDRFEVTLGRFRRFVAGFAPPSAGAGRNPNDAGDTGWDPAWTGPKLASDAATLREGLASPDCHASYHVWTESPGGDEERPMNCVTWYEAAAFCIWDGGRLPTEAEWAAAAGGGEERRLYPWGAAPPDGARAAFACNGKPIASCSLDDLARAGARSPAGDGRFGHADLAGNLWEWTADAYEAAPPSPCRDCASRAEAPSRVKRGGGFSSPEGDVRAASRRGHEALKRSVDQGFRCARPAR